MKLPSTLLFLLALPFGLLPAQTPPAKVAPPLAGQLRVEYRENPLGIDVANPRLSWIVQSPKRGEAQVAYQILVASTLPGLQKNVGDLWDSGVVKSDQTVLVPYAGKPLVSAQPVYWKVRVSGKDGQPSAWSLPATWTMGLLNEADWKGAQWIGVDPSETGEKKPEEVPATLLLRRDFAVKTGLLRATAFVCGLGYYEMTLNGRKVTDDVLTPGWTKYNKTCLYDTYDVTRLLQKGGNAVGLFLGNGMYRVLGQGRYTKFTASFGPQKAIAQIRLDYQDGTSAELVTDDKWQAAAGPVTFTSAFGGEDFDARLVQPGWDTSNFPAKNWLPVVTTHGPGGVLKGLSCAAPPIRRFDLLKPIKKKEVRKGVTVYDLGQNSAAIPQITVHGKAGSSVKITPAELVKDDGTVDQQSTGSPTFCVYTLAGKGNETWAPRFFYSGYRYLQVEGKADKEGGTLPTVDTVESSVIHTSSTEVGEFSTSNDLLNRIWTLVRWAQRSNMVSALTDCPHREKQGWLEQIHLNGPALRYNYDLNAFFTKTMNDMADSQLDNGLIPTTAPEFTVFGGDFRDSPEWGSAFVLVAWQQYQFTGDTELLRRYYDGMVRYVDYLGSRAKGDIVSHGLSDWYDIGPGGKPGNSKLTPNGVTATAFYYKDTLILAETAALLGKTEDAEKYKEQAERIRMAFNEKFFNKETAQYARGSQAANSIPVVMKMVDPARQNDVLKNIVTDLQQKGLTAGDIGYRYLLQALTEAGRSDVIFSMINQSDKPGYGMMLAKGATSLTEAWDGERSASQNHFMLGQINEWFYADLAGIQEDPAGPGFKKIIIKPAFIDDLAWVKASYTSVHGKIATAWKRNGSSVTLDVVLPANTTATIYLPAASAAAVQESGRPAAASIGLKLLRQEKGVAVFSAESGAYRFTSAIPMVLKSERP